MATFIGVMFIVCLLLAGIMFLILIQKAFEREGVVWGMISVFYPPGTYLFCKRNWDIYRGQFLAISILLSLCLVFYGILKVIATS